MIDKEELYKDVEWVLSDAGRELRDILTYLGMDKDLAMATLERVLPEKIVYKIGEDDG